MISDDEDDAIQVVSTAPETLRWPAGFDPDSMDLGQTDGMPFTANEQADPLISIILRRFTPRVDSYHPPQWLLETLLILTGVTSVVDCNTIGYSRLRSCTG